jgi:prostatic aicd phosphatase
MQQYGQPVAINTSADWCKVCGDNANRGCGALALAASEAREHGISRVGAGFVGAGVTIAIAAALLATLFFFGIIGLTRGKRHTRQFSRDNTFRNLESEQNSIAMEVGILNLYAKIRDR